MTRVFECQEGSLKIDGMDISEVPLEKLRRNITVIPEDHAIFEGTLRFNVDPLCQFDEEIVENTLKDLKLHRLLKRQNSIPEVLEYREKDVEGDGKGIWANIGKETYLSDHEKQLISICRAILRKKKFIFIDELTSCNGEKQEADVMNIVKDKFKNYTVINFTDRLHTVLDCD